MISLFNVSKRFGETGVLRAVNMSLVGRERVGLVGDNGAGKTTLVRILTGEIVPDGGSVHSTETVGWLPQEPSFGTETIQEVADGIPGADPSFFAYCLKLVGLGEIERTQSADTLSGGQKTRLGLAFVLVRRPTVLVLDEPTNHLDLAGLEWLGQCLKAFMGAVLIVSHDRAFLDRTVDRIIELENGTLTSYGGNYSFYEVQRRQERETALRVHQEDVAERKRLQRIRQDQLERAERTASRRHAPRDNDKFALNAHIGGAIRQFQKKARATTSRIEKQVIATRPFFKRTYEKGFDGAVHATKFLLGAERIRKVFGTQAAIDDLSFRMYGPERIWLSGDNGSGKSTLLALLAKWIEPDEGKVEWGEGVRIGYFAQDQKALPLTETPFNLLRPVASDAEAVFRVARSLGFDRDLLGRPVGERSRGQRAKLAIACLLLQECQVLLLDEPTNHLEISTRKEIEDALRSYEGALIVASHDRAFVDRIGIDRELRIVAGSLSSAY